MRRLAHMPQDLLDGAGFNDRRQDSHAPVATRAFERIDEEDSLQKRGPRKAARRRVFARTSRCR